MCCIKLAPIKNRMYIMSLNQIKLFFCDISNLFFPRRYMSTDILII